MTYRWHKFIPKSHKSNVCDAKGEIKEYDKEKKVQHKMKFNGSIWSAWGWQLFALNGLNLKQNKGYFYNEEEIAL